MYNIYMEEGYKESVEHQQRLNPLMKNVIIKDVTMQSDEGIIYPIWDRKWVSTL